MYIFNTSDEQKMCGGAKERVCTNLVTFTLSFLLRVHEGWASLNRNPFLDVQSKKISVPQPSGIKRIYPSLRIGGSPHWFVFLQQHSLWVNMCYQYDKKERKAFK